MTKEQLCRELSRRTGHHITVVESVVEHFQRSVAHALGKGDYVVLQGFGRFRLSHRKARRFPGIHGATVDTAQVDIPSFRAHKDLRHFVAKKLSENPKPVQGDLFHP